MGGPEPEPEHLLQQKQSAPYGQPPCLMPRLGMHRIESLWSEGWRRSEE